VRRRKGTPREERSISFESVFARAASTLPRRLLIGAISAVIVLVCLATALAWREYQDAKRRALNEVHARAVLAGTVFDTYFAGELGTLTSVAASPTVMAGDTKAMRSYFVRVQPVHGTLFTGGLGWIDIHGISRVSSNPLPAGPLINVSDRSYFQTVVSTGRPFISEGLRTKRGKQRVIVMAVPTRDARGQVNGVLAGALRLQQSTTDQRAIGLGYGGVVVIDRRGQQITTPSFARPENMPLLQLLQRGGEGVLPDTRGLGGESGHVVAYATSKAPGWTTVIDRPRSFVFAPARRGLILELILIGAAGVIVCGLIGWATQRSRRDAEVEQAQVRGWAELAQSLGTASVATEVSDALSSALATAFPEATVVVALLADGATGLTVSAVIDGDPPSGAGRKDVALLEVLEHARESGGPIALENASDLRARFPHLRDALAGRVRSVYAVPLASPGGRPVGALALLFGDERALDEAEEAIVAAQAEQAAQTLARTRHYEREHEVATMLQESLLPQKLPATSGLDLAGRYQAGAAGLDIGGDWYDVVRRPDGILHMTVGDVAGRGIPAATLMGQLRSAFRAYAYEHISPGEIVRRLGRHVPDDGMATAICLSVDPYTRELRYAVAGHPPPLLLDEDSGEVTRLELAGAPPLGWDTSSTIREARLALPPRATLLAYTDGLVERRGTSIDDGISLLAATLARVSSTGAERAAEAVLQETVGRLGADDDIALLLVQLTDVPARMEIEIPAHPAAMAGLRRRLQEWLRLRGLSEEHRADAVLAVSEACNNAIEHAYRRSEGTITLLLHHGGTMLHITVEDHGSWRPPQPDPTRGLGILIMNGTMSKTDVAFGDGGTRVALELRLQ
jgi:serine phosphatase RsbU (regulator of sigma subunit)/anti-sigma regulatory factor (Ser/Thr protein kinase)